MYSINWLKIVSRLSNKQLFWKYVGTNKSLRRCKYIMRLEKGGRKWGKKGERKRLPS